ncbi:MAG TPA: cation:dicarboxylase symporter family transporter [Steroidobacteraceae bacterium]|nr:cation:dicarboxylase symporter family transporter [Steroidobacteraceae bacterium]
MKTPASRVMAALVLGAAAGLALEAFDPAAAAKAIAIARPVGRLWLNALQMTVVPLVVALVVLGVNTARDAAASGRIARNALLAFVAFLAGGAALSALLAPTLFSLFPREAGLAQSLQAAIGAGVPAGGFGGFGEWLSGVVPVNAIAAAAEGAMLPLVVFSLMLGFALTRIAPERGARLTDWFQAIADALIVIVGWVLWVAPLGVFALVLVVCASIGGVVLGLLGAYIAVACSVYLSIIALLYVAARVGAGEPVRRFAAGILPAQAIAASTQSSLASLPAMLDCAQSRLGYGREVTGLVLPMAVTLFRVTSPAQYVAVASFVAWAYGLELSALQLAMGAALAVVISLGSVGLPGQVSFMATNLPVVQAMGLPADPLGLLLAVDTIPDAVATTGNVTGDLTATAIVARRSR